MCVLKLRQKWRFLDPKLAISKKKIWKPCSGNSSHCMQFMLLYAPLIRLRHKITVETLPVTNFEHKCKLFPAKSNLSRAKGAFHWQRVFHKKFYQKWKSFHFKLNGSMACLCLLAQNRNSGAFDRTFYGTFDRIRQRWNAPSVLIYSMVYLE